MKTLKFMHHHMPMVLDYGLCMAVEPFFHADRIIDFHVFIYVLEGVIHVTEEKKDYALKPGDYLILEQGRHHYGHTRIEKGTKWYFAHFRVDFETKNDVDIGSDTRGLFKSVTALKGTQSEQVILDYFEFRNSRDTWTVHRDFFDLLSALACDDLQINQPLCLSQNICNFLKQQENKPFSATAIEQHFYLSYPHLAATFKKECHMTMQQYHTKLRMEAAAQLLKYTLEPIRMIAEQVGYKDQLYFSRCFHQRMGMSPTAYRQSQMQRY